ncbi:MAG: arginine--tRNA ligase [Bacteroidota bacterium]
MSTQTLITNIQAATAASLKQCFDLELDPQEIQVQPTNKQHAGDLTVVIFPLLRYKIGKPEEVGQRLGEGIGAILDEVSHFEVVKGFLNLTMSDAFWQSALSDAREAAASYFRTDFGVGKQVMVEFSSPNTNKPLHLGHLRNNFLGDSICRILEAAGYDVERVNLVNDRGIHICKSMVAYQRFGDGETPESSGMKGDKLVGKYYVRFAEEEKKQQAELSEDETPEILEAAQEMHRKWEAGDEKVMTLWRTMNNWVYDGFEQTYKTIDVHFDKIYYESETYLLGKEIVKEGLEDGIFYQKEDGSVWVDLEDEGLDHKLLLRKDGTSVYITQDIGTAQQRFDEYEGLKELYYVVGNEQDYHFKVLSLIMKKLGRDWWDKLIHISYGMVDLPSGKMKSREGTVVDADELVQEMIDMAEEKTAELGKIEALDEQGLQELYRQLALGALKYYLLKVDPKKRMLFDPNESIDFQGDTGVFIQYSHARLSSILRKAPSQPSKFDSDKIDGLHETERELIKLLVNYPSRVNYAAENHDPAHLASFTYDLARAVGRFLYEVPVLKADTDNLLHFRLHLVDQSRATLAAGLQLLGVRAPEQM